jgi:hypothetical protein
MFVFLCEFAEYQIRDLYMSNIYFRMALELPLSVRYPPLLHPPRNHVVTPLLLSHNSMYHAISLSSSCLGKKSSS